jgi:hypothetical protein
MNYILIIIYKMASLLALMNRAITYFKESKSGTNSEVSTDDESNCGSSVDGMSTDEINSCEDVPSIYVIFAHALFLLMNIITERRRCNYCMLVNGRRREAMC